MPTNDRIVARIVVRADGEPLTDEAVARLRERVRTGYYDRAEVIAVTARAIAMGGEAAG